MGNNARRQVCIGGLARSPARHSFIMLKPGRALDPDGVARRLASIGGVRAVCMTSGNYAYVVAARNGSEDEIRKTCVKVRRVIGRNGRVSVALNHYVYTQGK